MRPPGRGVCPTKGRDVPRSRARVPRRAEPAPPMAERAETTAHTNQVRRTEDHPSARERSEGARTLTQCQASPPPSIATERGRGQGGETARRDGPPEPAPERGPLKHPLSIHNKLKCANGARAGHGLGSRSAARSAARSWAKLARSWNEFDPKLYRCLPEVGTNLARSCTEVSV